MIGNPGGQQYSSVDERKRPVLEVRSVSDKGRGVFACVSFRRDEVIEATPVIVIPAEQWSHIEPTVLALYIYNFGPEGEHAAIALGFGSLYNHSYSPNAMYVKSWEERLIRFIALRDIEAGEEITVNYNGSPDDRQPIWFDVKE
ncbi:MAG: SET domain-containing protein [Pyrinomonadaceae bacterium]